MRSNIGSSRLTSTIRKGIAAQSSPCAATSDRSLGGHGIFSPEILHTTSQHRTLSNSDADMHGSAAEQDPNQVLVEGVGQLDYLDAVLANDGLCQELRLGQLKPHYSCM